MCSIYGWIPKNNCESSIRVSQAAKGLAETMQNRGPDDFGWCLFLTDGSVLRETDAPHGDCKLLFGQTRLSIIDLSSGGHQPMATPDGRYTLVYNGELYNYKELKVELEDLGYQFRSQSDTEVLLLSFVHWKQDCVHHFNGMFAFAVYDSHTELLYLARDRFGIKPLFYHIGQNGFSFASELPALLKVPGTERKLHAQKAYEFLALSRNDTGSQTMVQNIYQLPPAHQCTVDLKSAAVIEHHHYWKPDLGSSCALTFDAAAEHLRELFLSSVRLHLRSDVPLGVALSGGIDSSAVACAVRYLYPDQAIHTFSYVADDSAELSEEAWIDLINSHIQAIPHKIHVRPDQLFDELDQLILRQGEPFVSTSIFAQHKVFQLVRQSNVTVTLDGQGADELLAGYDGYPADRLEGLIRQGQFLRAARVWRSSSSWPGRSARMIALRTIDRFVPQALKRAARQMVGRPLCPPWIDRRHLRRAGVKLRPTAEKTQKKDKDRLRESLLLAATHSGLPGLLRHGDRNSMTWSVESRVPFCTRDIAEFTLSLPEEYLVTDSGLTKAVFRKAMRGIVPDVVLDRKDKIGFQTPQEKWFPRLSAWVKPVLERAQSQQLIRIDETTKEWHAVESGTVPFSDSLWRRLCFLRWVQLFDIETESNLE